MKSIIFLFILKVFSVIGATFNTVGFFTFFFWESLEPYRWKMIIGGIVLIALAELAAHFLTRRMAGEGSYDEEIES